MLAHNLVRDVRQHAFDLADHTTDIAGLGVDSVALLSSALLFLLLLLVLLVVTPHLSDVLTVQVATDQLQSIRDYSLDTIGKKLARLAFSDKLFGKEFHLDRKISNTC